MVRLGESEIFILISYLCIEQQIEISDTYESFCATCEGVLSYSKYSALGRKQGRTLDTAWRLTLSLLWKKRTLFLFSDCPPNWLHRQVIGGDGSSVVAHVPP